MNDMVAKLNALAKHDAQIGMEAAYKLALMRVKAQTQNDGSRFRQAVGRTVNKWAGQDQVEWEAGNTNPKWSGQKAWEAAGSQRAKDKRAWEIVRRALRQQIT